ncbi:MAG: hypothetical protein HY885_13070 [Deltaproteobacteria bacterium]|nr:hypothetical protein [Deltaproteobacteria bacterium]
MKDSALTKNRQGVRTGEQTRAGLDTFAKGTITVMGGISALIGIWAAICFIGGIMSAGGPVELAYSWFRAVSGL